MTSFTAKGIFELDDITAGSDGALWFDKAAFASSGPIGRITTSGTETNITAVQEPVLATTAGPDGALWFTEETNEIGRITTSATPHL